MLPQIPMDILRLEVMPAYERVNCDLVMRRIGLRDPASVVGTRAKLQTQQTLLDVLALRRLIFRNFPDVTTARLRIFRPSAGGSRELVLIGDLQSNVGDMARGARRRFRLRCAGFPLSSPTASCAI